MWQWNLGSDGMEGLETQYEMHTDVCDSQHLNERIKASDKLWWEEWCRKGKGAVTPVFLRLLSCWYSWSGEEAGGGVRGRWREEGELTRTARLIAAAPHLKQQKHKTISHRPPRLLQSHRGAVHIFHALTTPPPSPGNQITLTQVQPHTHTHTCSITREPLCVFSQLNPAAITPTGTSVSLQANESSNTWGLLLLTSGCI